MSTSLCKNRIEILFHIIFDRRKPQKYDFNKIQTNIQLFHYHLQRNFYHFFNKRNMYLTLKSANSSIESVNNNLRL